MDRGNINPTGNIPTPTDGAFERFITSAIATILTIVFSWRLLLEVEDVNQQAIGESPKEGSNSTTQENRQSERPNVPEILVTAADDTDEEIEHCSSDDVDAYASASSRNEEVDDFNRRDNFQATGAVTKRNTTGFIEDETTTSSVYYNSEERDYLLDDYSYYVGKATKRPRYTYDQEEEDDDTPHIASNINARNFRRHVHEIAFDIDEKDDETTSSDSSSLDEEEKRFLIQQGVLELDSSSDSEHCAILNRPLDVIAEEDTDDLSSLERDDVSVKYFYSNQDQEMEYYEEAEDSNGTRHDDSLTDVTDEISDPEIASETGISDPNGQSQRYGPYFNTHRPLIIGPYVDRTSNFATEKDRYIVAKKIVDPNDTDQPSATDLENMTDSGIDASRGNVPPNDTSFTDDYNGTGNNSDSVNAFSNNSIRNVEMEKGLDSKAINYATQSDQSSTEGNNKSVSKSFVIESQIFESQVITGKRPTQNDLNEPSIEQHGSIATVSAVKESYTKTEKKESCENQENVALNKELANDQTGSSESTIETDSRYTSEALASEKNDTTQKSILHSDIQPSLIHAQDLKEQVNTSKGVLIDNKEKDSGKSNTPGTISNGTFTEQSYGKSVNNQPWKSTRSKDSSQSNQYFGDGSTEYKQDIAFKDSPRDFNRTDSGVYVKVGSNVSSVSSLDDSAPLSVLNVLPSLLGEDGSSRSARTDSTDSLLRDGSTSSESPRRYVDAKLSGSNEKIPRGFSYVHNKSVERNFKVLRTTQFKFGAANSDVGTPTSPLSDRTQSTDELGMQGSINDPYMYDPRGRGHGIPEYDPLQRRVVYEEHEVSTDPREISRIMRQSKSSLEKLDDLSYYPYQGQQPMQQRNFEPSPRAVGGNYHTNIPAHPQQMGRQSAMLQENVRPRMNFTSYDRHIENASERSTMNANREMNYNVPRYSNEMLTGPIMKDQHYDHPQYQYDRANMAPQGQMQTRGFHNMPPREEPPQRHLIKHASLQREPYRYQRSSMHEQQHRASTDYVFNSLPPSREMESQEMFYPQSDPYVAVARATSIPPPPWSPPWEDPREQYHDPRELNNDVNVFISTSCSMEEREKPPRPTSSDKQLGAIKALGEQMQYEVEEAQLAQLENRKLSITIEQGKDHKERKTVECKLPGKAENRDLAEMISQAVKDILSSELSPIPVPKNKQNRTALNQAVDKVSRQVLMAYQQEKLGMSPALNRKIPVVPASQTAQSFIGQRSDMTGKGLNQGGSVGNDNDQINASDRRFFYVTGTGSLGSEEEGLVDDVILKVVADEKMQPSVDFVMLSEAESGSEMGTPVPTRKNDPANIDKHNKPILGTQALNKLPNEYGQQIASSTQQKPQKMQEVGKTSYSKGTYIESGKENKATEKEQSKTESKAVKPPGNVSQFSIADSLNRIDNMLWSRQKDSEVVDKVSKPYDSVLTKPVVEKPSHLQDYVALPPKSLPVSRLKINESRSVFMTKSEEAQKKASSVSSEESSSDTSKRDWYEMAVSRDRKVLSPRSEMVLVDIDIDEVPRIESNAVHSKKIEDAKNRILNTKYKAPPGVPMEKYWKIPESLKSSKSFGSNLNSSGLDSTPRRSRQNSFTRLIDGSELRRCRSLGALPHQFFTNRISRTSLFETDIDSGETRKTPLIFETDLDNAFLYKTQSMTSLKTSNLKTFEFTDDFETHKSVGSLRSNDQKQTVSESREVPTQDTEQKSKSAYELRICESLNKLNIPSWYKPSDGKLSKELDLKNTKKNLSNPSLNKKWQAASNESTQENAKPIGTRAVIIKHRVSNPGKLRSPNNSVPSTPGDDFQKFELPSERYKRESQNMVLKPIKVKSMEEILAEPDPSEEDPCQFGRFPFEMFNKENIVGKYRSSTRSLGKGSKSSEQQKTQKGITSQKVSKSSEQQSQRGTSSQKVSKSSEQQKSQKGIISQTVSKDQSQKGISSQRVSKPQETNFDYDSRNVSTVETSQTSSLYGKRYVVEQESSELKPGKNTHTMNMYQGPERLSSEERLSTNKPSPHTTTVTSLRMHGHNTQNERDYQSNMAGNKSNEQHHFVARSYVTLNTSRKQEEVSTRVNTIKTRLTEPPVGTSTPSHSPHDISPSERFNDRGVRQSRNVIQNQNGSNNSTSRQPRYPYQGHQGPAYRDQAPRNDLRLNLNSRTGDQNLPGGIPQTSFDDSGVFTTTIKPNQTSSPREPMSSQEREMRERARLISSEESMRYSEFMTPSRTIDEMNLDLSPTNEQNSDTMDSNEEKSRDSFPVLSYYGSPMSKRKSPRSRSPLNMESSKVQMTMTESFLSKTEKQNKKPVDKEKSLEEVLDGLLAIEKSPNYDSETASISSTHLDLNDTPQGNIFRLLKKAQTPHSSMTSVDTRSSESLVGEQANGIGDSTDSESRDKLTEEVVIVKCRNGKCKKSTDLKEARKSFKTCHNCYTYYCSRECRKAHWVRHKKKCLFSRANSSAKHVIKKIHDEDNLSEHFTKLARTGYLSKGRGCVMIVFSTQEKADAFVRMGMLEIETPPSYVSVKEMQEIGLDIFGDHLFELVDMCKQYNPDLKYVVEVAIVAGHDVPSWPLPRKEGPTIKRCARLRLHTPQNTKRFGSKEEPETMILTAVPGSEFTENMEEKKAREVCFINMQRKLRQRGVSLRHQFQDVYNKLCSYVSDNEPFAPITIYPIDVNTGKRFMCLIMPNSEAEVEWMHNPNLLEELGLSTQV